MKERLTVNSASGLKLLKGKKYVELLADKELTKKALNRLAELEDKIENGTLIELPCKVGDKVYAMGQYTRDFAELEITSLTLRADKYYTDKFYIAEDFNANIAGRFEVEDIGKWVFLTREEAEKKLKELRGEQ